LIGAAASSPSAVGSRAGKRGDPGASPQADHVLVLVPSTTDKTWQTRCIARSRHATLRVAPHYYATLVSLGERGGSARCGRARGFRKL